MKQCLACVFDPQSVKIYTKTLLTYYCFDVYSIEISARYETFLNFKQVTPSNPSSACPIFLASKQT